MSQPCCSSSVEAWAVRAAADSSVLASRIFVCKVASVEIGGLVAKVVVLFTVRGRCRCCAARVASTTVIAAVVRGIEQVRYHPISARSCCGCIESPRQHLRELIVARRSTLVRSIAVSACSGPGGEA